MMSADDMDPILERIRGTYNVPGPVPREEMWTAISARIGGGVTPSTGPEASADGVDLNAVRDRKAAARAAASGAHRVLGWAVAAAALVVFGVGIGRMTAPGGVEVASVAPAKSAAAKEGLALAAREHLGETESFLTMVRAEAHGGGVDPATTEWARGLLAQTRLLLDTNEVQDQAVGELLLDLELVLAQIVEASDSGVDNERARTELDLALRGMEEGEVLPRLQAVLPQTFAGQ